MADSEAPEQRCLTHHPPKQDEPWRLAEPGYRVCRTCFDQLRSWLSLRTIDTYEHPDGSASLRPSSIPGLYQLLDAAPTVGEPGRRGPGFASRPPLNLHIVTMRDRRSKPQETCSDDGIWVGSDGKLEHEQEHPARSVPHTLASWAGLIAEEREMRGPAGDVTSVSQWLDAQLDWCARQDWIDDYADDLRALRRQLDHAAGALPKPKPVGTCIALLDDGHECGHPIYMPPGQLRAPDEPIRDLPELRCGGCGRTYNGLELLRLRLVNERAAS